VGPPKVDCPSVVGGGMRPRIACRLDHSRHHTPQTAHLGRQPASPARSHAQPCTSPPALHQAPSGAPPAPRCTNVRAGLPTRNPCRLMGCSWRSRLRPALLPLRMTSASWGTSAHKGRKRARVRGMQCCIDSWKRSAVCRPDRPRKHLPIHTHTHSGRSEAQLESN
jgi:hypothetical protein